MVVVRRGPSGLVRSSIAGASLLAVGGCDDYVSEQGDIGFLDDVLVIDRVGGFQSGGLVAVGSRACPSFNSYRTIEDGEEVRHDMETETDQWLRQCFVPSVSGPGSLDADGCIAIEGEGEVVWDLARTDCSTLEGTTIGDDRVRFSGIDPAMLTASFDADWDRYAASGLHPGAAGSFPEGFGELPSSPVQVVAGGEARLAVAVLDADGRHVAWSDAMVSPGVVAGQPELPAVEEPDEVALAPGVGDELEPTLELSGHVMTPGRMIGVEADEIASLELVVAHWPREDGSATDPVFARAIARSSDGTEIRGAPVSWSVVDGALALLRDEDTPGADYLMFGGACEPPPRSGTETRTATLQGRFGPHLARVELEWTVDAADCDGEACDFVPDPACEGPEAFDVGGRGCDCTASSRAPTGWIAALVVLGLAGVRRRRRAR